MQQRIETVRNKVQSVIAIAESKYGKLPEIDVRFDLRGKAAGQAQWRKSWVDGAHDFEMRFNREHISLGGKTFEHLVDDVVAHEIAHIICAYKPVLGKNHDIGWQRVCRDIGGNGERCYKTEDAPEAVAKHSPYIYTTHKGYEVRITTRTHNKIQRQGAEYAFRNGKGRIDEHSAFRFEPKVVELATPETPYRPLTITPVKHTPIKPKTKGLSKADQIRKQISLGKSKDECIEYGINVLGMKRTLARTYVKNNWNK